MNALAFFVKIELQPKGLCIKLATSALILFGR